MNRKVILAVVLLSVIFAMGVASAVTCEDSPVECIGTCGTGEGENYCNGTESISETFLVDVSMGSSAVADSSHDEWQIYFKEMSAYKDELSSLTFYLITIAPDDSNIVSKTVSQCRFNSAVDASDYFYANVGYMKIGGLSETKDVWQLRFNGIGNFSAGFDTLTGENNFFINTSSCVWNGTGLTPDRRLNIAAFSFVKDHGVLSSPGCKAVITGGIENNTNSNNIVFLFDRDLGQCYSPEYFYSSTLDGINILSQRTFINNYTWNVTADIGHTSTFEVQKNINGSQYISLWNISHNIGYTLEPSENSVNISPLFIDTRFFCFDVRTFNTWIENDTCVGYFSPDIDFTPIGTGGSGIGAPENESLSGCEPFINVLRDDIRQDRQGRVTIPWEYQTDTTGEIQKAAWDWMVALYAVDGTETGAFILATDAFSTMEFDDECLVGLNGPHYMNERLAIGDYKLVLKKGNLWFWGGADWRDVRSDTFTILPFDVTESRIEWVLGEYYTTKDAQLTWYAVNISNITVFHANGTDSESIFFQHNETVLNENRIVVLTIPAGAPEGKMRGRLRDNNTSEVLEAFTEVVSLNKIRYEIGFDAEYYSWGEEVTFGFSCRDDVVMTVYDANDRAVSTGTRFQSPIERGGVLNFTLPTRDIALGNKTAAGTWTVRMYLSSNGTEVAQDTTTINDYNLSDAPVVAERTNTFKSVENGLSWALGVDVTTAAYFAGTMVFILIIAGVLSVGADRDAVFFSGVVTIGFLSYINWMPPWVGLTAILGGAGLFAKKAREVYIGEDNGGS